MAKRPNVFTLELAPEYRGRLEAYRARNGLRSEADAVRHMIDATAPMVFMNCSYNGPIIMDDPRAPALAAQLRADEATKAAADAAAAAAEVNATLAATDKIVAATRARPTGPLHHTDSGNLTLTQTRGYAAPHDGGAALYERRADPLKTGFQGVDAATGEPFVRPRASPKGGKK